MAVRGALGATRVRLLRQLATESLLLAAGGGAAGLIVARAGTRTLASLNPANLPRLDAVQHRRRRCCSSPSAPARSPPSCSASSPPFRAAGLDLNRTLRATGSASGGAGAAARRADDRRDGAGARAAHRRGPDDPQLRGAAAGPARIRSGGRAHLPPGAAAREVSERPQVRLAFLRQMEEQLRAIPGVTEVGFTSQLPLTGSGSLSPFAYNEATARNWESETSDGRNVSPAYFRAMGTRLLAGRFFDAARHAAAGHASSSTRRSRRARGRARRRSASGCRCGRTARRTPSPK